MCEIKSLFFSEISFLGHFYTIYNHAIQYLNEHINKSSAISELCYKNKHIPKAL